MVTQSLTPNETPETEKRNASVWQFDPVHSSAEFAVRHMMVSTVKGTFKSLAGAIVYDEARPEDSQVEAQIDAASIDTGVADRDTHLRSADFFDVEKFPKLTFRSTSIEADGPHSGKMHGELTIHGVTNRVSLDVSYLGEVTDPWGNRRRGYTAETTLNRKDFGMTWNMVLDAGGVLVGDKIKVTLNIEAIEKAKA
jgi:polyisoprenoid-binding protein YceI